MKNNEKSVEKKIDNAAQILIDLLGLKRPFEAEKTATENSKRIKTSESTENQSEVIDSMQLLTDAAEEILDSTTTLDTLSVQENNEAHTPLATQIHVINKKKILTYQAINSNVEAISGYKVPSYLSDDIQNAIKKEVEEKNNLHLNTGRTTLMPVLASHPDVLYNQAIHGDVGFKILSYEQIQTYRRQSMLVLAHKKGLNPVTADELALNPSALAKVACFISIRVCLSRIDISKAKTKKNKKSAADYLVPVQIHYYQLQHAIIPEFRLATKRDIDSGNYVLMLRKQYSLVCKYAAKNVQPDSSTQLLRVIDQRLQASQAQASNEATTTTTTTVTTTTTSSLVPASSRDQPHDKVVQNQMFFKKPSGKTSNENAVQNVEKLIM